MEGSSQTASLLPSTESSQALTSPAEPRGNHGLDNAYHDLIVYTHDVLVNEITNHSYLVVDKLGQGTFGQVVRCWSHTHRCFVAIKIIKNQAAFHHQAMVEVKILQKLDRDYDADHHNFVRLHDYFPFRNHLCLVFELLQRNLFELIRVSGYQGFSLRLVQHFVKQILQTLTVLHRERIIHGDLKPENVLMSDEAAGLVKVIDFGSACMEHETVYSYIQSRFYRSPEVVLAYPYDSAIDMWSLGCIAAELYLGLPLFPAASERDLLMRMIEILGPIPVRMLQASKRVHRYFKPAQTNGDQLSEGSYLLLSEIEFEERHKEPAPTARRYFDYSDLESIVLKSKTRPGSTVTSQQHCFLDFLAGLLKIDPHKRWNAEQASAHPFVTGSPFLDPFRPPPSASRTISRPVGIAAMSDGWHPASWHPHLQAHSIAHEAAMLAVSQLASSVASNSSHMAPGSAAANVIGSVPGMQGMLAVSPEANSIMMAAMIAAQQVISVPSCPSNFSSAIPAASPSAGLRIDGFNIVQPSPQSDAHLDHQNASSLARHGRPMADIEENVPHVDDRELSFDLDLSLSHALDSCHLQSSNGNSSEQNNVAAVNGSDGGNIYVGGRVYHQSHSGGFIARNYTSSPGWDSTPSVWHTPMSSEYPILQTTSFDRQSLGMNDASSGSCSTGRAALERTATRDVDLPSQQSRLWSEATSLGSYETGFYGQRSEIERPEIVPFTSSPRSSFEDKLLDDV